MPLLIGGGAGSEVRAATGITVFAGMLGVTLFGLFLTPVFYGRSASSRAARRPWSEHHGTLEGKPMSAAFRLSALAMSVTLAACAVGPDFKRPDTATAARFARDAHPAAPSGTTPETPEMPPDASADADAAFWRGFGDPVLTQLIDTALAANRTCRSPCRATTHRMRCCQATFDRYPTITASGQIGHQLMSRTGIRRAAQPARYADVQRRDQCGVGADLFGRVRRSIESQRAETAASAADVRAVRVAIAGEVASTYVDLRGSQERLRIARENADNQKQTLALINARVGAESSELDAARARAQYESTTSRIAVYEAAIGVDEHRLAVLTGQTPDALIGRFDLRRQPRRRARPCRCRRWPPTSIPARRATCCGGVPTSRPPRHGCTRRPHASASRRPTCFRVSRCRGCSAVRRAATGSSARAATRT